MDNKSSKLESFTFHTMIIKKYSIRNTKYTLGQMIKELDFVLIGYAVTEDVGIGALSVIDISESIDNFLQGPRF